MYGKSMRELLETVAEDYTQGRDVDGMALPASPGRGAMAALTEELRGLVFPGFFPGEGTVKRRLAQGIAHLRRQIAGVMPPEADTRAVCRDFLAALPEVRAMAQTDLQAAFDGDPAAACKEEIILSYPGLFAVTVYRLAHVLYGLGVPLLPRCMSEYAHSVTGIDLHPGAVIGPYFFIDHGTGVVVGQTAVIGSHVKLYQGVTLGGLSTRGGQSLRQRKRHPTVEDHVTVYAGATILGGDTVIGTGAVIGAGAFITASVAPDTTVTPKIQELQFHARREKTGDIGS